MRASEKDDSTKARWCADAVMWAKVGLSFYVVLVLACLLPNVTYLIPASVHEGFPSASL